MQAFTDAVVQRFQSINPDKDGATVKGVSDLKNEIQIITLPDHLWAHWHKFLIMHANGDLIDPVTLAPYRDAKDGKKWKPKSSSLKKQFFKSFAWFTDKDFGVVAQHLLGDTPGRRAPYPKVSVPKTKILVAGNMSAADWAERRKRKKIVLQDIMSIKPTLKFLDNGGDVNHEKWRPWKKRHLWSSATWDFLLSHPNKDYFVKRLRLEGWHKRPKDYTAAFPEVLHMYTRFMTLKYRLPDPTGGVQIRGVDMSVKALVTSSSYSYTSRTVNLAVLDARAIPRTKPTENAGAIDPFLEFLADNLEPDVTDPNIWLIILSGKEDFKAASTFAEDELDEYEAQVSTYVPSRGEMLNNVTSRNIAPDVILLFLFKKDNEFAKAARKLVTKKYTTPLLCEYYKDASKNTEAKWRVDTTELRMEFYFQLLHACAVPKENVLGIYAGAKFMLASKVYTHSYRRVDDYSLTAIINDVNAHHNPRVDDTSRSVVIE